MDRVDRPVIWTSSDLGQPGHFGQFWILIYPGRTSNEAGKCRSANPGGATLVKGWESGKAVGPVFDGPGPPLRI